MKLSPREAQALIFIRTTLAQHGRAPFQYEIASHLGTKSRGFVYRLLGRLCSKGLIRWHKFKPSGIELADGRAAQVRLNSEIFKLVSDYANAEGVKVEVATNELLRQVLGAAA